METIHVVSVPPDLREPPGELASDCSNARKFATDFDGLSEDSFRYHNPRNNRRADSGGERSAQTMGLLPVRDGQSERRVICARDRNEEVSQPFGLGRSLVIFFVQGLYFGQGALHWSFEGHLKEEIWKQKFSR